MNEIAWLVVLLIANAVWLVICLVLGSKNNSLRNELKQYDPTDPRHLPPDSWKEVLTSIKPICDKNIKTCPFCGSAAELKWWWIGISVRLPRFNVECKTCTAKSADSLRAFDIPMDAIEAWNVRG